MRYLCLIYSDDRTLDGMPKDQWDSAGMGSIEVRPIQEYSQPNG
jgi:hypothetical protein